VIYIDTRWILLIRSPAGFFHFLSLHEEHPEHEGLGLIQYRCEEWTDEMSPWGRENIAPIAMV
jgi:hypothetical protein